MILTNKLLYSTIFFYNGLDEGRSWKNHLEQYEYSRSPSVLIQIPEVQMLLGLIKQ